MCMALRAGHSTCFRTMLATGPLAQSNGSCVEMLLFDILPWYSRLGPTERLGVHLT